MGPQDPRKWMWAEACMMIDRAERLKRQFFEPVSTPAGGTAWEPPVDMFESDRALWVIVALPGVVAEDLEVVLEDRALMVAGLRRLPAEIRGAAIRRIEVPHGRFVRRVPLPARRWRVSRRDLANGCLFLCLEKEI